MKKLVLNILLLLLLAPAAMSQNAEYELIRHTYKVNGDGTSDYTFRKEVRLIRQRSFAEQGETFIVYNPDFQLVSIKEAYTLQKDGTKVPLPDNAKINQLPRNCANCGRLNNLRELVIVHTGLEYDALVVLEYNVHSLSVAVNGRLQLQQADPVKRFELIVDLPDVQKFDVAYSTPLPGYNHPITTLSDGHRLHLVAENLEPTLVDSYLPDVEKLYNIVTFSNNQQPDPVYEAARLPQARRAFDSLQASSDSAYIATVRNHMLSIVRLNDVCPAVLGYKRATSEQVWQSACGTAEELSVLLADLLNQNSFAAKPLFNQKGIVEVTKGGSTYRVSAINQSAPARQGVTPAASRRYACELPWQNARLLADGYYQYTLPVEKDACKVSAGELTSVRTAPVMIGQVDESYEYTLPLPRKTKLVGDAVNISQEFAGLGKVSVVVKQKGRKVVVCRSLTIKKDVIESGDYANFRQLMQTWSLGRTFYLHTK